MFGLGGFLGSGNTSAKTDRGRELAGWQDEWTNLRESRNRYDQLYPGAQALQASGAANLNTGADYWKGILSGRAGATAAIAPEINQVNSQADMARNAQANLGTARTGGTAGEHQQLETQRQTAVNNAIFGARPAAAQQISQVGSAQGQQGNEQLSAALRSLGMSDELIQHLINSSSQSRTDSYKINQDTVGKVAQVAQNLLALA